MNKKYTTILFLSFLLSTSFVFLANFSTVKATPTLLAYNFDYDYDQSYTTSQGAGARFTASSNDDFLMMTYWVKRDADGTGILKGYLYTYNASGDATHKAGVKVGESTNEYNVATQLTTSYSQITFTFNNTALTNGVQYLGFYDWNTTGAGNLITKAQSGGELVLAEADPLSSCQLIGTAKIWYVFYTDSPDPTPTPAPTPTPTPSGLGSDDEYYWNGTAWVPVDNIVETTTDLLLPLLIPLIIILICAGLGAYFVGLWGFVLGLDVAVVLLYVALPTYMPLWGVLIVAVGNVIVLLMGRR